jgi:hypothetical protein
VWAVTGFEPRRRWSPGWPRPACGGSVPGPVETPRQFFASLAGVEFHIFDARASAMTRWWPSSMSSFIFKETGVAVSEENEVPSGTFDADDKVSRTCPTLDTHQSRVGVGGVNEAL